MIKPTLISITNELVDLQKTLEDSGGELSLELELKMAEVLAQDLKKITSYTNVLNSYQMEIAFVQERIKDAQEYIKKLQRMQEKLLEIAGKAIEIRGENLEGDYGRKIYTRKSSYVDISVEPTELPIEYQKMTIEPNKALIKEKILAGEEVPGCQIKERTNINWK